MGVGQFDDADRKGIEAGQLRRESAALRQQSHRTAVLRLAQATTFSHGTLSLRLSTGIDLVRPSFIGAGGVNQTPLSFSMLMKKERSSSVIGPMKCGRNSLIYGLEAPVIQPPFHVRPFIRSKSETGGLCGLVLPSSPGSGSGSVSMRSRSGVPSYSIIPWFSHIRPEYGTHLSHARCCSGCGNGTRDGQPAESNSTPDHRRIGGK